MIRDVFLPALYKNYYLFTQHVVGFDIGKTHVTATHAIFRQRTVIIDKVIHISLDSSAQAPYAERVTQAITAIMAQMPRGTQIRSVLSSSLVTFKELRLPFLDLEHIKQVVRFEVEPLLPFAIQTAAVDCVITHQDIEQKQSTVLVAAVQQQHIDQHKALFEAAGYSPSIISVDMLNIAGLYNSIPAYVLESGVTALVDIGYQSTRIAFMYHKRLLFIRTLNKGTLSLAKTVAQELNMQPAQVYEEIMRNGVQVTESDNKIHSALRTALGALCKDITFTFDSLSTYNIEGNQPERMLILGGGSHIPAISELLAECTGKPCSLFTVSEVTKAVSPRVRIVNPVPASATASVAAAFPSELIADFSLIDRSLSTENAKTIFQNMIATVTLLLLLFSGFITFVLIQRYTLSNEAHASEQEAVDTLFRRFPALEESGETALDDVVEAAKDEVSKEEKLWGSFSTSAHPSFLEYLLELFSRIDKESLGLELDRLTMNEDTLTIKGRVRGFNELKTLERDLRQSKLFTLPRESQDPNFTLELRLNKERGS